MKTILATAASALILGTGVALATPQGQALEFPMTQDMFLATFDGSTILDFERIDTARDGVIHEEEFEEAVEQGIIEDPRG
ncbi:MAG: hypothetical protein ACXIUV_10320 [Alkalilacustris sp.]